MCVREGVHGNRNVCVVGRRQGIVKYWMETNVCKGKGAG